MIALRSRPTLPAHLSPPPSFIYVMQKEPPPGDTGEEALPESCSQGPSSASSRCCSPWSSVRLCAFLNLLPAWDCVASCCICCPPASLLRHGSASSSSGHLWEPSLTKLPHFLILGSRIPVLTRNTRGSGRGLRRVSARYGSASIVSRFATVPTVVEPVSLRSRAKIQA